MVITVLLGGPVYTGTVESESAARKVLQAKAKAEEQSLEWSGWGTEITPIILGYSFSEKRRKPLDFIHYGMARSLSFPDGQSDMNMLNPVMGTATPRTL